MAASAQSVAGWPAMHWDDYCPSPVLQYALFMLDDEPLTAAPLPTGAHTAAGAMGRP